MKVASPFELSLTKIRTCLFKVHFQTVGVAILILIICGIAPISAAIAVAEFSITLLVGAKLAATALERPLSSYEFIGFGFVFGAPLAVAISQLFLLFTTPTISSFAPILIGTTYLLTNKKQLKQVNYATTLNHEVIFEILVIAMLLFSTIRLWLMPISLSLLTVRFAQRKPTGFRVLFSSLVVIVGIVVSMHMRTEFWWYTNSNDSAWFESISWSINQWGLFENPGYVGGSIAKYHWLSYAWTGHISKISNLESWESLNIVSPIFCLMAAVGVFGSILGESWKSLTSKRVLTIYGGVASFGIVVSVTSLNYSFIGLMALALIVGQLSAIRLAKQLIILIYLLSVVFLSKVTSGLVAISLILSVAPFLLRTKNQTKKIWIFVGPIFLLTSAVSLNYWSNSKIALVPKIEYLRGALSQLENPYFLPVFATSFYLVIRAIQTPQGRQKSEVLSTLLIVVFSFTYFLSTATLDGEYIIYAVSTLALFKFYLFEFSSHKEKKSRVLSPVILVGIVATGFWFYRHPVLGHIKSGNSITNSIFQFFSKFGLGIFVFVMLLIFAFVFYRNIKAVLASGVIILILLNLGIQFDSGWRIIHHSSDTYERSGVNAAPHASLNLRLLAAYIDKNTEADILLASNNFCCSGDSWFDLDLNELRNGSLVFNENSLGGANFLLPAYTRRKFLIQGPRFLYKATSNDWVERMHLSLDFANHPTLDTVEKLKSFGVNGFVVNLSLTQFRNWSRFAKTLYSNEEFVYLSLI